MPSPGAADQHRNQVNRNERGRERDGQTEKYRVRTRKRERLKERKGRKLEEKEFYLQQTLIKTIPSPTGH